MSQSSPVVYHNSRGQIGARQLPISSIVNLEPQPTTLHRFTMGTTIRPNSRRCIPIPARLLSPH